MININKEQANEECFHQEGGKKTRRICPDINTLLRGDRWSQAARLRLAGYQYTYHWKSEKGYQSRFRDAATAVKTRAGRSARRWRKLTARVLR